MDLNLRPFLDVFLILSYDQALKNQLVEQVPSDWKVPGSILDHYIGNINLLSRSKHILLFQMTD